MERHVVAPVRGRLRPGRAPHAEVGPPVSGSRHRLPGDPDDRQFLERVVRVDHAGEYGATRIYAGQLAVLGRGPAGDAIRHMAEQERQHLAAFERIMAERRIRPTVLMPIWHVAGFLLGAGTAILGEKAAMACTVAVEEVIDEHYKGQIDALGEDEAALTADIARFRDEEIEHRDTGLAHGAESTPGYEPLAAVIKAGSRLAIWLSERL